MGAVDVGSVERAAGVGGIVEHRVASREDGAEVATEPQREVLGEALGVQIDCGDRGLQVERELGGRGGVVQDDIDGVAPGVDDTPIVAFDQRRHALAASAQRGQRAYFVGSHEAAVSGNIRRQNCRKPPFHAIVGQERSSRDR